MSAGDPIGRLFNLVHTADGVFVSLREASAVTFVGQLDAGDTFTIASATDAAGTSVASLPKVSKFNTAAKAGGVWSTISQASSATAVTATSVVATITIRAEQLPDGHTHVRCTSTGPGTVLAILHDLRYQATPASLLSVIA